MTAFVLDVSSAVPLVFDDEVGPDTRAIEEALTGGGTAYVPTLWRYELCNVLRQGERHGRCTPDQTSQYLEVLWRLPIDEVETSSPRTLVGTARIHDLTVYDMSYLLLAQRLAIPLATRDERLRRAAGVGEVEIFGG